VKCQREVQATGFSVPGIIPPPRRFLRDLRPRVTPIAGMHAAMMAQETEQSFKWPCHTPRGPTKFQRSPELRRNRRAAPEWIDSKLHLGPERRAVGRGHKKPSSRRWSPGVRSSQRKHPRASLKMSEQVVTADLPVLSFESSADASRTVMLPLTLQAISFHVCSF